MVEEHIHNVLSNISKHTFWTCIVVPQFFSTFNNPISNPYCQSRLSFSSSTIAKKMSVRNNKSYRIERSARWKRTYIRRKNQRTRNAKCNGDGASVEPRRRRYTGRRLYFDSPATLGACREYTDVL